MVTEKGSFSPACTAATVAVATWVVSTSSWARAAKPKKRNESAVAPINVQGNETAGANRVTIGVVLSYTNTLDEGLSLERTFSRYYDLPSDQDVFSNEDLIVSEIGDLLSQDMFNATLGNW